MLNECMNVPFPAFSPTTPPESIFSSQHIFEPPCTCLYSPFTPAVHLHSIPPFANRWMVISSPEAEAGGGGGGHNQLDTECERRAVNSGLVLSLTSSPFLYLCNYAPSSRCRVNLMSSTSAQTPPVSSSEFIFLALTKYYPE